MDTLWWIAIVIVLVVAAIFVFLRSRRTEADRAQDRRITVQKEGGAHSAGEEISQREDRRLGGMSAEDRAWETASLERQRDRDEQARSANDRA
jgi:membrane protein implicated in regulation of membrane protease activity